VTGLAELPGKSNYFIGNDPKKWRTNVPNYAKVKYENVYPGVDLVYYGNQRQLEYDFVVQPGADPKPIKLGFTGDVKRKQAAALRVDGNGDLVVGTNGGEVIFHKPLVYQPGARHEPRTKNQERRAKNEEPRTTKKEVIDGNYVLKESQVTFEIARYDKTRPLVIDPALVYSTYLGGSSFDLGQVIAVDASGNAYVTGQTGSTDFPATAGAFRTTFSGGNNDAFVSKLNAAGSALLYSTYLGGRNDDFGYGIAVDASGNAYVAGLTYSSDFPTTPGAFQTIYAGGSNVAFVSKLNAAGSALLYSTYLGSGFATGIAVNSSGNAYVTGEAGPNFPTTAGAFQATSGGDQNAFISMLDPDGSALVYSTYLGGRGPDTGDGIAVDASGNAYVTGRAGSSYFPTTPGAFQTTFR